MPALHSCPPGWHRSASCHSCNTNSTTHGSSPLQHCRDCHHAAHVKKGGDRPSAAGQYYSRKMAAARCFMCLRPPGASLLRGTQSSMHAPASLICHAFRHQLQQHNCRPVGLCEQLAQQPLIHLGLHFVKPAGMENAATTLSMAKPLVALHCCWLGQCSSNTQQC